MALQLIDNIPLLKNSKIMIKYARYLKTADFRIDPLLWILLSLLVAIIVSLLVWFLADYFGLEQAIALGFLSLILVADLMLGYPFLKAEERINQIEELLPEALRQMSDVLKSGGTYELALKEVATSDYGPLKVEFNEVLRKLEEGENFQSSFRVLQKNIDSKLVQRTVTIIIDAIEAGGGLSNVLEQIAEDVRELHRIGRERKASTAMQVIFIFAAGGVIAPMIFGFVTTIANMLIASSSQATSESVKQASVEAISSIKLAIEGYLIILSFFSGLMISIMRDGRMTKTIIYFPILLLISYFVYLASAIVSGLFIKGA
ncbi:MAG: type II secretion system F family protein [Candidatus Diapherotrites archaeon]